MNTNLSDQDLSEIKSDIKNLIDLENKGALLNILVDLHPVDIAYLITDLKKDQRKFVFRLLPTELGSEVLTELDSPLIEQILEDVSDKRLSVLVEEMDSDDAADIISDLPDELAERVLEHVDQETSDEVKELLHYDEDTAGGIMALEFIAVNENQNVNEIIEAIRAAREEMDQIHNIWVVGNDNYLLGTVALADLVLARGNVKAGAIMSTDVKKVNTNVDQEEVAIIFKKYDLVSLPVVNDFQQLVGEITIDDIVDVLDEEVSEDISRFAGARDEEIQEESFLKISWVRLPWLFVAFVGQIISAVIIESFSATISQLIALTFFMPVIMAMGGNSGIQSSTIVIRGLATGEISMDSTLRRFLRELRVSLFLGLIFGILIAFVVGFWLKNIILGSMIGIALNLVILQATLFGGIIPFVLKRFNVDPALASGPFITTFNDILGLMIYLVILTSSLSFFL